MVTSNRLSIQHHFIYQFKQSLILNYHTDRQT